MDKKAITVFTPTYNRGYCLHRLYESLQRQTNKDFLWLVIDDGSKDNTKELVQGWINEDKIAIQYHYQENKGMVGAHNTAHYIMTTELCVCIDSDDYMPSDAIEKILVFWKKNGRPDYAGIVGLDSYKDGKIVGTMLPNIGECRFSELYAYHKVKGDKKFVHNRCVFNQYLPYPTFYKEKFPVTSYLYLLIEQKHKLLIMNEVLAVVEYMPDGLSMNLIEQYKRSPKSFAFYRKEKMKYAITYNDRFKNAIHYVSSSLMLKDFSFLKTTEYKIMTIFSIPFGILLYLYINYSKSGSINRKLNKG